MRTIISAFTLMLLTSCEPETAVPVTSADPVPDFAARGLVSAGNTNNPYDDAGLLHYDVLEAYLPLESETMPATAVIAKLDSIANSDLRYTALVTSNYKAPTTLRISQILADPAVSTAAIVAASGMSTAAKSSIINFLADVTALYDSDSDFDDAYELIVDYESDVAAATSFTTPEKKVLLITASIARYGYWFSLKNRKRKPRDRDWDYLITTLTSGTEGATSDTASAIMMSVSSAALANQ